MQTGTKHQLVTIGLMDKTEVSGRLNQFATTLTALVLQVSQSDATIKAHVYDSEKVAYVGFLRGEDSFDTETTISNMQPIRVHLVNHGVFEVNVNPAAVNHPIGFYGECHDATSPFEKIFFYHHAIKMREKAQPLGEVLIQQGLVEERDIRRGVELQAEERSLPLGRILVEQNQVDQASVDRAVDLQERRKLRLGEVLLGEGLITQIQLNEALEAQKHKRGKKLGEILVGLGVLNERELAVALAMKFNLPFVNLNDYPIDHSAAKLVPRHLIEKYRFLPLGNTADTLTVAISDPLNIEYYDMLHFAIKKRIREVIAAPIQLDEHIAKLISQEPVVTESKADAQAQIEALLARSGGEGIDAILNSLESEKEEAVTDTPGMGVLEADSSLVRLAGNIILEAWKRGASDIHIEPRGRDRSCLVRFRVDGACERFIEVPAAVRRELVQRYKIMAKLDISEKRLPQDGKIVLSLSDRKLELRVATIPTANANEDIVMRILAGGSPLSLEEMYFEPRNLEVFKRAATKPYGLILVVGPTGSGKTTTLHSALKLINTPQRKIWTAEDPVEITQEGLRQVQVQPRIGFTFARAMRAFLRADPDVIMVGEMRDLETATIAAEASLTGHLVFSTLHTNTAPETIARLLDMGLDPFNFADALNLVAAQRLVRRLCTCHTREPVTDEILAEIEKITGSAVNHLIPDWDRHLGRATGCERCQSKGYKGRIAIHEVLEGTPAVRLLVQQRRPPDEIRNQARKEGFTTMMADGYIKVLSGLTDFAQVKAVCSD